MFKRRRVMGIHFGDVTYAADLLQLMTVAEGAGFQTGFVDDPTSLPAVMNQAQSWESEVVLVSLGPDVGVELLDGLKAAAEEHGQAHRRWMLAASPLTQMHALQLGFFEACLDATMPEKDVADCFRGLRPRLAAFGPKALVRQAQKVLPLSLKGRRAPAPLAEG